MHSADYAVARCLSVCPSHAGILSKRLNISLFRPGPVRSVHFGRVPTSLFRIRRQILMVMNACAKSAKSIRCCRFPEITPRASASVISVRCRQATIETTMHGEKISRDIIIHERHLANPGGFDETAQCL